MLRVLRGRPFDFDSETVSNKARVAGADQWLRDLPDLIASIERDWQVTLRSRDRVNG